MINLLKDMFTSSKGSFKVLFVTLNRIPNFSSFLDKTLVTVTELRTSSSNLSILSIKLTPESSEFGALTRMLLHCRLRIKAPTATAPTNRTDCHTKTLFPNHAMTEFCELEIARLAANPIEITADEARDKNSTTDRKASKAISSIVPDDFRTMLSNWKALSGR